MTRSHNFIVWFGLLPVALARAGTPAVGVALADGRFWVDQQEVRSNATILAGSRVTTGAVAAELRMLAGNQLTLAPQSELELYASRAVLRRGTVELEAKPPFELQVDQLALHPEAGARLRTELASEKTLRVTAIEGTARLTTAQGVLVARLGPGETLELKPVTGAAAPVSLSGCVRQDRGRYVLDDPVTHLTVELEGEGLDRLAGRAVRVTGAPGPRGGGGQTGKLRVLEATVISHSCPSSSHAQGSPNHPLWKDKRVVAGILVGGAAAAVASIGWATTEERPASLSR